MKGNLAMVLSAVVKSIRLRHTVDAVAFTLHAHQRFGWGWYRVSRRILIGAAEDGISIPVQLRVSDWFSRGYRHEAPVVDAVREIARICAVPNWWAQPEQNGHDYIYTWDRGEKLAAMPEFHHRDRPFLGQLDGLEHEIRHGQAVRAIAVLSSMNKERGLKPALLGKRLREIAERQGNREALEVLGIYLRHIKSLAGDSNFSGQAVYRLARGALGLQGDPEITNGDAQTLLDAGHARLAELREIPPYLLNGVHAPGKDRRFAGMSADMAACCRAFLHYGRLDPTDTWLEEFSKDPQQAPGTLVLTCDNPRFS